MTLAEYPLLCDSDFLISLAIADESTHRRAAALARKYMDQPWHMLDVTLYECISVVSRKYGQPVARQLYSFIEARDMQWHRAAEVEAKAWDVFFSYKKKNISFTDCANLTVARKYGWKIASFDAFYPKDIVVAS